MFKRVQYTYSKEPYIHSTVKHSPFFMCATAITRAAASISWLSAIKSHDPFSQKSSTLSQKSPIYIFQRALYLHNSHNLSSRIHIVIVRHGISWHNFSKVSSEVVWHSSICRALLSTCKALLSIFGALFPLQSCGVKIYVGFFWVHVRLFWVYVGLFFSSFVWHSRKLSSLVKKYY